MSAPVGERADERAGERPATGTEALPAGGLGADMGPAPAGAPAGAWAYARQYLGMGWKLFVLPRGGGQKGPAANCTECREADRSTHDKEACPCLLCHSFYAATDDPARLRAMWEALPHGLLAVRTGAPSGITVIDAESMSDTEDGYTGVEVVDLWEELIGTPLPNTARATSASGGVHLYYRTGNDPHIANVSRVAAAVDLKSNGGYVVAPPGGGGERRWLDDAGGGLGALRTPGADLLAWLRGGWRETAGVIGRGVSGVGGGGVRFADYAELLKNGVPIGSQEPFLNVMLYRVSRFQGVEDAEELTAYAWPIVQTWPQDRSRPWTRAHVREKAEHVLRDLRHVERVSIPARLPRSERDREVVRTDDVATDTHHTEPLDDVALPLDVADVIPVDFGGTGMRVSGGVGSGWEDDNTSDGGRVGYDGSTDDGDPATEGMHDTGNANRFVRLYGENIRWISDEGCWLTWNGVRWVRDRTHIVPGWTVDVMTDIYQYARTLPAEEAKPWLQHMRNSYATGRRAALLKSTQCIPGISVTSDVLDARMDRLVVRNGVLDLVTGELRKGVREDLNTLSADVVYDPHAPCPRWEKHIRTITCGDRELAAYLQRLAGYTLTGHTTEQAFFSLEGDGANGKNAFIEPIMLMMGDYADTADSRLVTSGDKTHASILAGLVGKRLIFLDEIPAGRAMDVERVKAVTGGLRIKAQFMAKDWFAFTPQMKLWIAGNAQPPIRDGSDGIWRRMHRVMFRAKIREDEKVKGFSHQVFEAEGSGILNWCLAGLADWRGLESLGMPQRVRHDVEELRQDEDHVLRFVQECCEITGKLRELGPDGSTIVREGDIVRGPDLQEIYKAWCRGEGIDKHIPHTTKLARRIHALAAAQGLTVEYHGIKYRSRYQRCMEGIRLTANAMEFWGAGLGTGN